MIRCVRSEPWQMWLCRIKAEHRGRARRRCVRSTCKSTTLIPRRGNHIPSGEDGRSALRNVYRPETSFACAQCRITLERAYDFGPYPLRAPTRRRNLARAAVRADLQLSSRVELGHYKTRGSVMRNFRWLTIAALAACLACSAWADDHGNGGNNNSNNGNGNNGNNGNGVFESGLVGSVPGRHYRWRRRRWPPVDGRRK